MTLAATVLLRMGLAGFSREALLSRESGTGRPVRRAATAFRAAFNGRPSFPRLLSRRPVPLLISALGFPVGAGLGYLAGATGAIPSNAGLPVVNALLAAAPDGNPAAVAAGIFAHNLIAIVLAAGLAALTLGLTGFALTLLPGFLVGYAAAFSSWPLALMGILPHGLLELPAVIVAGALAIEVGATAIHMEPDGGWSKRMLAAQADFIRSLRWLVPVLAVAAVLEAYVTIG
jgi:stage II sporulation protein M